MILKTGRALLTPSAPLAPPSRAARSRASGFVLWHESEVPPLLAYVSYRGVGRSDNIAFSQFGRVEMWRGGCRPNISVVRLFRLAVP